MAPLQVLYRALLLLRPTRRCSLSASSSTSSTTCRASQLADRFRWTVPYRWVQFNDGMRAFWRSYVPEGQGSWRGKSKLWGWYVNLCTWSRWCDKAILMNIQIILHLFSALYTFSVSYDMHRALSAMHSRLLSRKAIQKSRCWFQPSNAMGAAIRQGVCRTF